MTGNAAHDGQETGLFKRCPRCGRMGTLARDLDERGNPSMHFSIKWEENAESRAARYGDWFRGQAGAGADYDIGLSLRDILSPELGCGYCCGDLPEVHVNGGASVWRAYEGQFIAVLEGEVVASGQTADGCLSAATAAGANLQRVHIGFVPVGALALRVV